MWDELRERVAGRGAKMMWCTHCVLDLWLGSINWENLGLVETERAS